MLKLADLRKTTRRGAHGDVRTLHPSFLRDRSLAPRIELAIRYLEGMLGRPRRDLEQEVIVQLFGDHKMARCIVACLAAHYRHRARTFAEVLSPTAIAALAEQGISGPSELRLWLFRRANVALPGFVGGAERAPFLADAGAALGLDADTIERLITLDVPEQAILVRVGPKPSADDVIARFNYETVAAVLASSPLVRLSLQRAPRDADALRALADALGVSVELTGREVVLHGRQDALDGWTRHGARLVRLVTLLLACGLAARSGEAIVAAPMGGQWHFRIGAEHLGYLGARERADFAAADILALLAAADTFAPEVAALRRAGPLEGWGMRRATEPLVLAGAVVPALYTLARDAQRVILIPAPSSDGGAAHLAEVAARVPLVALALDADAAAVAHLPTLCYGGRGDAASLPDLLATLLEHTAQRQGSERLTALCEEARGSGVLTEQAIAERLDCEEDDVPARLAEPEARRLARDRDLHYVDGFGLCSAQVLVRARAAAQDVSTLRDRADGRARVVRVLGRRLREVTGTAEGIECLIAYLGAA